MIKFFSKLLISLFRLISFQIQLWCKLFKKVFLFIKTLKTWNLHSTSLMPWSKSSTSRHLSKFASIYSSPVFSSMRAFCFLYQFLTLVIIGLRFLWSCSPTLAISFSFCATPNLWWHFYANLIASLWHQRIV